MTTAEHKESRPIVNFDHRDEESKYHPHERWKKLREETPVAFSEKYGGFWVLSRYADTCAAARDVKNFSSELQQTAIPTLPTPPFPPVNTDAPLHREYRMAVNPFFSVDKVEAYLPWLESVTAEFVKPLLASDHFNVAVDLGIPLTRAVTLHVMGIESAPVEINQWSDELIFQSPNAEQAGGLLMDWLGSVLADRRARPRDDDFMSGLVQAEVGGHPLDDDECKRIAMLVLTAGLETTNSAISGAVWYLVQNPDVARKLAQADDTTWRLAMDEFVRWTSPAPAESRTVVSDTEFGGCPMAANQRVMLLFGAANRDETEFPDPDAVILDRRPNRHLGFGMGPHRCLGSHLAKAEMQCVLQSLVGRLPEWSLDEDSPIVWHAGEVRGIRSLSIVKR